MLPLTSNGNVANSIGIAVAGGEGLVILRFGSGKPGGISRQLGELLRHCLAVHQRLIKIHVPAARRW